MPEGPTMPKPPNDGRKGHWLLVSHAFNMDGRAASLTVTDRLPSFKAAGIALHVVSAITGEPRVDVDHRQVLPAGPSALRFDLRHLLARRWGRGMRYRATTLAISTLLAPLIAIERLATRLSSNWSWAGPATRVGMAMIRAHPIEVIYSSGGEWSAHEAGRRLHLRTGIPWVAEIHDPLVVRTEPGDDGVAPRPTREGRRLQRLEADICRDAAAVWLFTDAALKWVRHRHPNLGTRGFVIRPGAPPPGRRWCHAYRDRMHIGHFGVLGTGRTLEGSLTALARVLQLEPNAPIQLDVYGTRPSSADLARIDALGLAAHVTLHGRLQRDAATGRSGRDRVHEAMQTSDALLLLHGDHEGCSEYIPSKLYEYLWTGRPVLAVTHRNPELDEMVRAYEGIVSPDGDMEALVGAMRQLLDRWRARDLTTRTIDAPTVEDATRQIVAAVRSAIAQ